MPQQKREVTGKSPARHPTASSQAAPSPPPSSSQVVESSRAASKRKAVDPPPKSEESKISRPGDGWYVVQIGVLPGVYYGVNALKIAKPKAGGFFCAADQESADQLFLELSINSALVFLKE